MGSVLVWRMGRKFVVTAGEWQYRMKVAKIIRFFFTIHLRNVQMDCVTNDADGENTFWIGLIFGIFCEFNRRNCKMRPCLRSVVGKLFE